MIFAQLGIAQINLALLSFFAKIRPPKAVFLKTPALRDRGFKCQRVKSLRFSKCHLFLKATDRVSVRSVEAAHVGITAEEGQVPRGGTTHGTRPIVANGANIDERTMAAAADAGNGQFKR